MSSARQSVALLSRFSRSLWRGTSAGCIDGRSALNLCPIRSNIDQRRSYSNNTSGIDQDGFPPVPLSLKDAYKLMKLVKEYQITVFELGLSNPEEPCRQIMHWTMHNALQNDFERLSDKLAPEALEQARYIHTAYNDEERKALLNPWSDVSFGVRCKQVEKAVNISMLRICFFQTFSLTVFGAVVSIPEDSDSTESWKVIRVYHARH